MKRNLNNNQITEKEIESQSESENEEIQSERNDT